MNNLNNGQKVGVLTFHRAENYGSVLQAYALQKYLTDKLGIENELDCLYSKWTRGVL